MRRYVNKTRALSLPQPSLAGRFFFFTLVIAALLAANHAQGAESSECRRQTSLTSELELLRGRPNNETQVATRQTELDIATRICDEQKRKIAAERERCDSQDQKLWSWNDTTDRCEDRRADATKSNPNSGECNNADLFKNGLKGEACGETAQTIKDVNTRQEAIGQATTAAATAYSGFQATQATGAQADAQNRQRQILQALAISKITTGGLALTGAAQLQSAAGSAEEASETITGAQKQIQDECTQAITASRKSQVGAEGRKLVLSDEQCFYKTAPKYGVEPSSAEYANYERMKSGAGQSQAQADKARQLRNQSMISGLADTLVGVQALYMSRQTQQNALGMGEVPVVGAPPRAYAFGSSGQAVNGGIGNLAAAQPTVDYGVADDAAATLGADGGPMRGSLKGGKGFGVGSSFKSEKSGVSGGGGGGGAGGGFNRSGSGASRGKGGRAVTSHEYANTGGGLRGPGAAGAGPDKNDGTNAFAEALAKLFPQDPNGKPVVDSRGLASQELAQSEDEESSEVYAADLSIFDQISARYRRLSTEGRL